MKNIIFSWAIAWGIGTKVVWKSSIVFDIANASQVFLTHLFFFGGDLLLKSTLEPIPAFIVYC